MDKIAGLRRAPRERASGVTAHAGGCTLPRILTTRSLAGKPSAPPILRRRCPSMSPTKARSGVTSPNVSQPRAWAMATANAGWV